MKAFWWLWWRIWRQLARLDTWSPNQSPLTVIESYYQHLLIAELEKVLEHRPLFDLMSLPKAKSTKTIKLFRRGIEQ